MAAAPDYPYIVSRRRERLSDWVSLVSKQVVRSAGSAPGEYHSFFQADYVSVLAIRPDGLIPIVRQYRPALERYTYELPGGLLDRDVAPETVAISEVFEETGYRLASAPILLGCLAPDTGRLENRLWGYFARTCASADAGWVPEQGIEVQMISRTELREMITTGQFDHALHIALIGLALTKDLFSWE
jgi:8-oxo-dGTP pyrophosphatase MutT (NUDIX family)